MKKQPWTQGMCCATWPMKAEMFWTFSVKGMEMHCWLMCGIRLVWAAVGQGSHCFTVLASDRGSRMAAAMQELCCGM